MNGASLNILQDRIEKLKAGFPEIFSEGKIDMEKFKALFTDDIHFNNERYVLNWAGKSDAFKTLQIPTTATLKPQPEESVNFDTTENVFIEGENLEVLKVLQKSYYGKIKCIIIDPPYNTGNDSFIYPDSFKENKTDYEKRIGDKDEEGYLMKEGMFRKNSKDSGHYHSNWLSMMYPRLFLAKNLLREDGVIFVHIDDNEVHNLRMIMNEIFGEENFVACFPRITKKAGKTTDKIAKNNDYILCFSKNDSIKFNAYAVIDDGYKNQDEYFEDRGYYKLSQTLDYGSIQYSPSLDYEIKIDETVYRAGGVSKEEMEERKKRNPVSDYCWRWSRDLFEFGLKNGFIVIKNSKNGSRIYTKTYQNASISKNASGYYVETILREKSATTLEFIQNKFSNDNSRKDFNAIFENNVFEYSKPVQLISELVSLTTNSEDTILDFFAGSGTTAQAVLELNKEDGGNRKFILVQLPELCDENSEAYKAGYKTIADISKERIRRVIKTLALKPSLTPNPSPTGEGDMAATYTENLFKGATPTLFENAHNMRLVNKTEAEGVLWQELRNRKVADAKFRRQHPIGRFIADFYCHEHKLIVEVDGGYHNLQEQKEVDEARTLALNEFGIQVIRFTNDEVINNIESVKKKITDALLPSPKREGAGGEAGIKVFKLSPSNFKIWRGSEIDEDNLVQQLEIFTNPVREGSEEDNMLYELMLKAGYSLTDKIEKLKMENGELILVKDEVIFIIKSKSMQQAMDKALSLIQSQPSIKKVITLDILFKDNDQLKTNTVLQMRDAGVEFKTI